MKLYRITFVAIAFATLGSSESAAQTRADSAVLTALDDIRVRGQYGRALLILRGEDTAEGARVRQILADSLTRIASSSDTSVVGYRASFAAFRALAHSAKSEGQGRPFSGAASRLFDIASTPDAVNRGGAVYSLAGLARPADGLQYLVRIAESDRAEALMALEMIDTRLGQEGQAALRGLYARRAVHRPSAKDYIERLARERRWPNPR